MTKSPVCQTIFEMLEQRGYKNIKFKDEKNDIIVGDKGKKSIQVFITDIIKFNTEKTQEYINIMQENNIYHSIIVYKKFVTTTAKKNINKLPLNDEVNIKIELFCEDELIFNITKHRLQPTFKLLTQKENTDFKNKYGKKIPIMLTCDPISKFYNYKPGDIIKIIKSNGYVSYRIVKLKI